MVSEQVVLNSIKKINSGQDDYYINKEKGIISPCKVCKV